MEAGESAAVGAYISWPERGRRVVLGMPMRAEAVESRVGVLEPQDVVFEICTVRVRDVVEVHVKLESGL